MPPFRSPSWAAIKEKYKFRSCAIVGNSGVLAATALGRAIDSHDVVMRMNQVRARHR
jgi:hypothetical protein